ncbi:MAG: pantetheine-phosphate adenylyltransferase [Flavobacteriaceae bacterium]|nr:pantetheine-phosphate adenylyltransferase [Flavobacteriaceae bacterium]
MKKAVFPGSFDPITLGHLDVINRGLNLFDEVIIAIGVNTNKKYMFSLEERKLHIENAFKNEPRIKVSTYKGLTVDYCKTVKADYILRGLRNSTDFNYEQSIAQTNSALTKIESIFLVCAPNVSNISSSIVRDVIRNGGDCKTLVPKSVLL